MSKLKEKWDAFCKDPKIIYWMIICSVFTVIGFLILLLSTPLGDNRSVLWGLPLFIPGGILCVLFYSAKIEPQKRSPEQYDSLIKSIESLRQQCKRWMEDNKYNEVYQEELEGFPVIWGYKRRRDKRTRTDCLIVVEYTIYTEEMERQIIIAVRRLIEERTGIGQTLSSRTIIINCVPSRQSALTNALMVMAAGGVDLILSVGYVEKDRSLRIQRRSDNKLSNMRMLNRMRSTVLDMFKDVIVLSEKETDKE